MTKDRIPGRIHDVVHRFLGFFGADEAGRRVGRSGSLLRKAADPDNDFMLDGERLLELDEGWAAETGEMPPYLAYHQERIRPHLRPHEPMEAAARAAQAAKESGEATAALLETGPEPSHNEYAHARREMVEARDAWDHAIRDLDARYGAVETGEGQ